MIKSNNKIWRTSFGTSIAEINPEIGVFKVIDSVSVPIDTPLQDVKGTTKTFLEDSIIEGSLWEEFDQKAGKKRKVILVKDEDGRYLVPAKKLEPTTREFIESQKKISGLENELSNAKSIVSELQEQANYLLKEKENGGFLEKKYGNFTMKEILIGAIGVVIIVKLLK